MSNLIIDAARDKIFFTIIADNKSYTTEYINNRENFDKLAILIIQFLENNNLNISDISNIFVNQGPGKTSSIRTSIAIAKAIALSHNISLYGFNSKDFDGKDYKKLLKSRKFKIEGSLRVGQNIPCS